MIVISKRLKGVDEYYFSQKLKQIDELNKQGKNIINLGIGNPDLPPHTDVIKALQEESIKPNVHGYQNYKGSPVLRKAISHWYAKWYGVSLNADTEILPLIGSKEGIMHICMTYLNEGDFVLVPNPGYPSYASAAKLAGGTVINYELNEKNNWYPDFDKLKNKLSLLRNEKMKNSLSEAESSCLMFVNYPHMPSGQLPTKKLFKELVTFATEHHVLICHDNPYSFILNEAPMSILSIDGAKDVAIELNSLSKSHNMAGWRVGMLLAAEERINQVLHFKSNMDSGMFLPVQLAAAKALSLDKSWFAELNNTYKARREKIYEMLNLLHCHFSKEQAGLFIWAKIPSQYKNGYEFSDDMLCNKNIFITPGGIFGSAGDGYFRISLCNTVEKFEEAIKQIKEH